MFPVVFVAFGKTHKSTKHIIKKCAKYDAARSEHSDVIPLSNTMQKGTAYQVMLTQFRRAIGVLSVRTIAEIKIRRTRLMRRTFMEVNVVVQPEQEDFIKTQAAHFGIRAMTMRITSTKFTRIIRSIMILY